MDRSLPVNDPRPLADQVAATFDTERLAARLVSVFGALALVLACVGLYGVVSQAVARRTGEIGVRMALGAVRGDVLWLILKDTLVLVAIGLAVSVPAFVATPHIASCSALAPPIRVFRSPSSSLTTVAAVSGSFRRGGSRVDRWLRSGTVIRPAECLQNQPAFERRRTTQKSLNAQSKQKAQL